MLEPLHMALRLGEVLLEAGLEFGRLGGLGQLGQRLGELPFGVIDILEGIEEQVVECLFVSLALSHESNRF